MSIDFDKAITEVKTIRLNYGAPDEFKLKTRSKVSDLYNHEITIDKIIVVNHVKTQKNKETGEYEDVKTKDGSRFIYQATAFVAYDSNKYFASNSQMMIRQIERLTNTELVFYEEKTIEVPNIKDVKVKIVSEKVKYKDGDSYDQPIFANA